MKCLLMACCVATLGCPRSSGVHATTGRGPERAEAWLQAIAEPPLLDGYAPPRCVIAAVPEVHLRLCRHEAPKSDGCRCSLEVFNPSDSEISMPPSLRDRHFVKVTHAQPGLSMHTEACTPDRGRCTYWSGPFTLDLGARGESRRK